MHFSLRGYQYAVLLDWRERRSTAEWPWDRLCDELRGAGVPNADEALVKLRLRPLHDALREVLSSEIIAGLMVPAESVEEPEAKKAPVKAKPVKSAKVPVAKAGEESISEAGVQSFLEKSERFFTLLPGDLAADAAKTELGAKKFSEVLAQKLSAIQHFDRLLEPLTADWSEAASQVFSALAEKAWPPIIAWFVLGSLPEKDQLASFDRLQLRQGLAEAFNAAGIAGEDAWRSAARVRLLLAAEEQPANYDPAKPHFWSDPDVRWLAGVNESEGKTYFNKESFQQLMLWMQLPELVVSAEETADAAMDATVFDSGLQKLFRRADEAGYNLEDFLAGSSKPVAAVGS
jgi:hypothetical protein